MDTNKVRPAACGQNLAGEWTERRIGVCCCEPAAALRLAMKKLIAGIFLCLLLFMNMACAEIAEDLTSQCRITSAGKGTESVHDGLYTSFWRNREMKNGYLEFETPEGKSARWLYICFGEEPQYWEIQAERGGQWETIIVGEMRYAHTLLDLGAETHFRLIDTSGKKAQFKINEVSVFGDGELPDWVQVWQPTQDKADILLLAAHPDDELLFFGGTIPDYGVERGLSVVVAYMSYSNTTRKSELLNGLWSMGVRNYPVIGTFHDTYSGTLEDGYHRWKQKDVDTFITGLIRRYRPEVILSHDVNGEYGHGAHKVCADAALRCSMNASDPTFCPDSAQIYGTWDVKKVYLHLAKEQPIHMNWRVPLASQNGRTGLEAADAAYRLHVTQATTHFVVSDEDKNSCADFGLVYSTVGPDVEGGDFLEHIEVTTADLSPTDANEKPATVANTGNVQPTDAAADAAQMEPSGRAKVVLVMEPAADESSATDTSNTDTKQETALSTNDGVLARIESGPSVSLQTETAARTDETTEQPNQALITFTPDTASGTRSGMTAKIITTDETASADEPEDEQDQTEGPDQQAQTDQADGTQQQPDVPGVSDDTTSQPAQMDAAAGLPIAVLETATEDGAGKAGPQKERITSPSAVRTSSETTRKPYADVAWPADLADVPKDELGYAASGEWVHADDTEGLWFYATPTLVVRVERIFDPVEVLTWYEAHIFCDLDRERFGSILYDPDKPQNKHVQAKLIAKENQVVFGMNTDYYTYRLGRKTMIGMVIRDGRVFFDRVPEANRRQFPNLDTLAMYDDGHWAVYRSDERLASEYIADGAIDVWSFGPYLIRDGEYNPFLKEMKNGFTPQPRCAIGMVEPGHYYAILAEGRIKNVSVGVDIQFLADHAMAVGCKEALNLDGGQTAVMCFMGQQITRIGKYNGGNTSPRATTELMGIGHSDLIDPNTK